MIDVRRHIERRMEVHPADLGGVLADLPRERVDEPLDHVRRLRPAGAAVGVGRSGVRHDAGNSNQYASGVYGPM